MKKTVQSLSCVKVTKEDLGREKFLERAWAWKKQYGDRIISQLKKLGSSCDWERERFTLDEGCSRAVREVFVKLYEKGLIYKGKRIINWCPHCKTSLSDAEVEYEEQAGNFWHIRYPLTDGSGFLEVATTRPETMLGDTALAVHPDDARYKELVGKTVVLPLVGKEIPVVADSYVEMDFGTGVVKITPAHDPNDFEVGKRQDLEVINILTEDGHINENGGQYAGLDRYEARKRIVDDLETQGYLLEVEEYKHNVGTCYRCGTTVEPYVSTQWFVRMEPLAAPAIQAVREGKTKFVPERFDKIYFNWMENIKDWCISRQLWWGHRIPAFYCDACGEMIVTAADTVDKCPKCGSTHIRQDEDTLDTWFSSALWPFSTLGWPDKTPELDYFYPTNTLVTGYDIIFFWVARMIFSGIEQMGETPFDTVYIHGIVRDAQGRKMSKSLGNGIDPLEIIDQYGADALRFALTTGTSPGNDMRFSEEKVLSSRNFTNKLWNAARFILMNLPENVVCEGLPEKLTVTDKWILSQYNTLVGEVNDNLERFELGLALGKIYSFLWDVFCDWYIELAKPRLQSDDKTDVCKVLVSVLSGTMKLLHPFMPFITEELWQALPHIGDSIMISSFPEYREELSFTVEEEEFQKVIAIIKEVRNVRAAMNVPTRKKAALTIVTDSGDIFAESIPYIEKLAFANPVHVTATADMPGAVRAITPAAVGLIPMDELVDREKELARLSKEKENCLKEITMVEGKLKNEGFLSKAPEKVVQMERDKLQKAKEKLSRVEESLAVFR